MSSGTDYQKLELAYARSPDQDAHPPARHPVVDRKSVV